MPKNAKIDRKRRRTLHPAVRRKIIDFTKDSESWDVYVLRKIAAFYESRGGSTSPMMDYALGRARWGSRDPEQCAYCGAGLRWYDSGWVCKSRSCQKTTSFVCRTRFHRMELDSGQLGLLCFLVGAWPVTAAVKQVPAVIFERVLGVSPAVGKKIRKLVYVGGVESRGLSPEFLKRLSDERFDGRSYRPRALVEKVAKQLLGRVHTVRS